MPDTLLRTPAGEPVVVYALVTAHGPLMDTYDFEDDALANAADGVMVQACHLLPLPEDARTAKRSEGGA